MKLSILLIIALILPLCLGESTQINILTHPSHKVDVFILDPAEVYSVYDSFHLKSDYSGMVQINYTTSGNFDVKLQVFTFDNKLVLVDRLKNYVPGETVYILALKGNTSRNYEAMIPKPEVNITNLTSEENVTANITTTNVSKSITGKVISFDSIKSNLKYVYYFFGAILIAGLVLISVLKFKRNPKTEQDEKNEASFEMKAKLAATEKELQEARKQINQLKNQEKIKQLESQIEKERAELDKLRQDSM